ncbi:hypothetical protein BDZ45DRAFT_367624 [Acephala macrosclerotiorum]|nr:hypothetical protein BDZ45DRAFT_367624 [Acephala macrosclerotiorum]
MVRGSMCVPYSLHVTFLSIDAALSWISGAGLFVTRRIGGGADFEPQEALAALPVASTLVCRTTPR